MTDFKKCKELEQIMELAYFPDFKFMIQMYIRWEVLKKEWRKKDERSKDTKETVLCVLCDCSAGLVSDQCSSGSQNGLTYDKTGGLRHIYEDDAG